jgi:transcriptional regulator with XRE-family HTH domain
MGLSQEAMAQTADLDRTHYSAIERGERNPTYSILVRVSAIFDIELSELQREAEALRRGPAGTGSGIDS